MNIKLKAGVTVIGFFGSMIVLAWVITSIPEEIIIDIVLGALSVGCLAFAYWVALDYYKGVEVLKELEKERFERETDKNISTSDGQITTPPIFTYDDGEPIKPPRGRRLPKKGEDTK